MNNGRCDFVCNFAECDYDNRACLGKCECPYEKLFNNECNPECNTEKCFWDNGACEC